MIVAGMGEYLGWYTCENGHPFSVGECTLKRMASSASCINSLQLLLQGGHRRLDILPSTRAQRGVR